MVEEIELCTLDLRYESYRLRNRALELRLLDSIAQRGIEEPVEGVDAGGQRVLLDGFKRCRCARKLGIGCVPYVSLGEDEAAGIIRVLRAANHRALSLIEQARFIDDLRVVHKLSVGEIAELLERSKSWVSMRVGLIGRMSETVREKIFSGAFPLYCYMYTIRRFMRMSGVKREEVDEFIGAVSGHKLSVREIERLAHGYFRGPEWFRKEVQSGNLALALERMEQVPEAPEGTSEFERVLLRDLEIVGKYMQRVMAKSQDPRLKSQVFRAQANLLSAGILSRLGGFNHTMRELYDRTGQA